MLKIVSDERTTFLFKGTSLEKCIVNILSKSEKKKIKLRIKYLGIKSSVISLGKVQNMALRIQNILVIVVRQFEPSENSRIRF